MAISPGGRPMDTTPFSTSRTSNYVARGGGLPDYVRGVAHALLRTGRAKTESQAIQMAIGVLENWASGRGKVRPQVRAAAAKAVAEFHALPAKARAMSLANDVDGAVMQINAHQLVDLANGQTIDLTTSFASVDDGPRVTTSANIGTKQMRSLVKQGKAMPGPAGPRFPIRNHDEVRKAVRAVGRAKGDHAAVRRFIIRRAKALGASHLIPDNWTTSGGTS